MMWSFCNCVFPMCISSYCCKQGICDGWKWGDWKRKKENGRIRASLPVGGQSWPWRDELDGGIERTEEEESQLEYKRSGRDGNWFCIDYHNRSHLFTFYSFSHLHCIREWHSLLYHLEVGLRKLARGLEFRLLLFCSSTRCLTPVFMNLVIQFFKCNQSQSPINWTLVYLKRTEYILKQSETTPH